MTQIENGENAWKKTAVALDLLTTRYVRFSLVMHVIYILIVLAIVASEWFRYDHKVIGLLFLILFSIAFMIKQVYLRRWKEFLIVLEAKRRVVEILILGPDYICDIYNFTPKFLFFTLGTKPKNLYQSAKMVSGQINWFLRKDGLTRNRSLLDGVYVFSAFLTIFIVRLAVAVSGHELEFRTMYGGIFQGLGSGLISIIGVYFMYSLDKLIASLRMVTDAIQELDS